MIEEAYELIKRRVLDSRIHNPIWPNTAGEAELEIGCVVGIVPFGTEDPTLKKTQKSIPFVLNLGILKDTGIGEAISLREAELAGKVFLAGQRIKGRDCEITVQNHATIGDGYRDGAFWRVPVTIPMVMKELR